MPKKGIPDRWLDYKNTGTCISGTRFIAFKVPLLQNLCIRLPPKEHWTPEIALQDIPMLGMVVDLTNTFRYYNPEVFLKNKIEYTKIQCKGHGTLPGKPVVDKFYSTVSEFLNNQFHSGQLIGVHCTHGLNRTGYLICRYMIEKMGFSPGEAIAGFNKARGHPIERTEYLSALTSLQPFPILCPLTDYTPWSSGDERSHSHNPGTIGRVDEPRCTTFYLDPHFKSQGQSFQENNHQASIDYSKQALPQRKQTSVRTFAQPSNNSSGNRVEINNVHAANPGDMWIPSQNTSSPVFCETSSINFRTGHWERSSPYADHRHQTEWNTGGNNDQMTCAQQQQHEIPSYFTENHSREINFQSNYQRSEIKESGYSRGNSQVTYDGSQNWPRVPVPKEQCFVRHTSEQEPPLVRNQEHWHRRGNPSYRRPFRPHRKAQ